MGRILGVSIGLIAVLALIWFCSGNGISVLQYDYDSLLSAIVTEPEATQTLAPVTGPEEHTFLVAKGIGPYRASDGLSDVAALELWNTGKSTIKHAEVAVHQQDRQLRFVVSYLPAGCGILVPEKTEAPYTRDGITDFQCLTAVPLEGQDTQEIVSVTESGAYSLTVSNLTQQTVNCVRILYKPYLSEQALLQGGVTYCVVVPDLAAGETREIAPYLYAAGEAKVVAVLTE